MQATLHALVQERGGSVQSRQLEEGGNIKYDDRCDLSSKGT